jgi:hypothetical protein
MITHGHTEEEWTQVWKGCGKTSRACNEEAKERNVEARTWWKGRKSDEQEAGDRDRTFGGTQEGREGSCEAEVERRAKEDGWREEAGHEAEMSKRTQKGNCR